MRLALLSTLIAVSCLAQAAPQIPATVIHEADVEYSDAGWASGFAVLPGGGLLIADYTGRRLLEVDASGELLHELRTGPRTIASVDVVP